MQRLKKLILITLFVTLSLGLAACIPVVQDNLSPLDKALAGIGGEGALENLTSFVVNGSGNRWAEGEGFTHSEAAPANVFQKQVSYDVTGDNLRVDVTGTILFAGFNARWTSAKSLLATLDISQGRIGLAGPVTGNAL